jgi:hypothetical protein
MNLYGPMVMMIRCSASSRRQRSTTVLEDKHQGIKRYLYGIQFLVKNLLFEGSVGGLRIVA